RNWAVWLHEYLRDFPGKQDVLRYVLTSNAPEAKDNDFTWKDYQAKNNNELLAIYGNFVNRTLVLTHKYFDGKVPEITSLSAEDKQVTDEIKTFPGRIGSSLEKFRFRESLAEMMNLARLGNKYLTDNEPWKIFKTDIDRVKTILNISLQICANLSIVSAPFLPFTSGKLAEMMNLGELKWQDAGDSALVKAGHEINTPSLLFEKVEDAAIEAQVQKLLDTRKANQSSAWQAPAAKENIEFDDFAKLDVRVGTIVEAEKVAKTKKLIKLTVDTGIDKRTVVSGIAEYFNPEDIIGKKVSILVNLAPKKLKGIDSQGMILMAENPDGTLGFVSPPEGFVNGSEIR
ncbi:MAG: methionine--tRNA ligase subunit beta, partial [Bacteroidales bacterium]